ncbi:MAG: sensor domain-containing diguanylate cyclase [Synergistaceae bacterium]|jgi:diguanylate cyclase (GGDEF)-like protein/PAS domain S-box-containing protein|nr:sensor domain-containing diguanylate cyclase [Synergistaceae bacterium]
MADLLNPSPRLRFIFDNLLDGLYFVDKQGKITYWNPTAERISGYKSKEVMGRSCRDGILSFIFVKNEESCIADCPLLREPVRETPLELTASLRHKRGYRVPIRLRCVPLLDENGGVVGAAGIFEYVSTRNDARLQIEKLGEFAYNDSLTKIPNRRYMEDALHEWAHLHFRGKMNFAVVMADIDFFKKVNDEHGHDVGDLVLKKVAETLKKNLRCADIVGRWGGEEFLLLLQDIPSERLRRKLESLRMAIEEDCVVEDGDVTVRVTMSFGCSVPREDDAPLTLVARADELLYKSKREGRNRVSIEEIKPITDWRE